MPVFWPENEIGDVSLIKQLSLGFGQIRWHVIANHDEQGWLQVFRQCQLSNSLQDDVMMLNQIALRRVLRRLALSAVD